MVSINMNKYIQKELATLCERLKKLKALKIEDEKQRDVKAEVAKQNIEYTRKRIEHVEAIIEVLKDV